MITTKIYGVGGESYLELYLDENVSDVEIWSTDGGSPGCLIKMHNEEAIEFAKGIIKIARIKSKTHE